MKTASLGKQCNRWSDLNLAIGLGNREMIATSMLS